MTIITKKDLSEMEEYYFWSGNRQYVPFPADLKRKLLKIYGKEPLPRNWTEQDIHEGSRKIIIEYFQN
ncbi:hypothetical protein [Virgibacillus siamensis]|uniref:hypothetical protein n=1 Tax=Virgibacillus siamensis TaxID=480071 RepID=UPI0009854202|nr:hypothetical protein [Virgibacillus siamensis]